MTWADLAVFLGHLYPEQRRPDERQKEQVKHLVELEVPASSIQNVMRSKHHLSMMSQDVHNFKDKICFGENKASRIVKQSNINDHGNTQWENSMGELNGRMTYTNKQPFRRDRGN